MKLSREDFFHLFIWGIQFDPELHRISQIQKKRQKGTYWTPAMMGFLDRLGSKLGFETDTEFGVFTKKQDKPDKWVDMVWEWIEERSKFRIFIEHEGSSYPKKIEQAISRLKGSIDSFEGPKADLRILISYPYLTGVSILKTFSEEDEGNLSIWYSGDDWPPSKSNAPVDLTKFRSFPEEVKEKFKNTPGFNLLEKK